MTDSEISAAGIKPTLTQTTDGEILNLSFAGDWLLQGQPSDDLDIEALLDGASDVKRIRYDTEALGEWDTGLITSLANIQRIADLRQVENDTAKIPTGAQQKSRTQSIITGDDRDQGRTYCTYKRDVVFRGRLYTKKRQEKQILP